MKTGPSIVYVLEFSGLCEAPGGPEAAGVPHDNPRAQTCTRSQRFKHHENSEDTLRGPTLNLISVNSSVLHFHLVVLFFM